ncbi:MAG: hypothetical protein ACREIT_06310 [Tepidisphaeraceae bacterium]
MSRVRDEFPMLVIGLIVPILVCIALVVALRGLRATPASNATDHADQHVTPARAAISTGE